MKHIALVIGLMTIIMGWANDAAACTSPSGVASQTRYDTSENKMYYCNGTNWVEMAGGSNNAEVAFTVTKTSDQTVAAGGVVDWQATTTDLGGDFDLATDKFTAPVDGPYYFHASFLTNLDATPGDFYIFKNGANTGLRSYGGTTNDYKPSIAQGVLTLAAGDTIDIRATTNSSQTLYGDPNVSVTTFTGFLLNGGSSRPGSDTLAGLSCLDGQVAAWNDGNGEWECADGGTGGSSATSMIDGWPDAIVCSNSSTYIVLNHATNRVYRLVSSPVDAQQTFVRFNADKTYRDHVQMTGFDCLNKSISQLYADGQAFNFVGGNGGGGGGSEAFTQNHTATIGNQSVTNACNNFTDVNNSSKTVDFPNDGPAHIAWGSGWYMNGTGGSARFRVCVGSECSDSRLIYANEIQSHKNISGSWATNVSAGPQIVKLQACLQAGDTVRFDVNDAVQWSVIQPGSGSGSDTLAGLSCLDGQVPAWNDGNSAWECANGSGGGGVSLAEALGLDPTIWPEYIRCPRAADNFEQLLQLEAISPIGNVGYVMSISTGGTFYKTFTPTGDHAISADLAASCDNETLTQICDAGRCFFNTFGGGSADNLGNHTATENIVLGANYLSGDGGDEGVYVDASGNVGIGTTTPESGLHIEHDRTPTTPVIIAEDTTTGTATTIFGHSPGIGFNYTHTDGIGPQVYKGNGYASEINFVANDADINAGKMFFKIWDTQTTDRSATTLLSTPLVLTKEGNVGIGTATPRQDLHVDNGTSGGGDQTVAQFGSGSESLFLTHNAPHVTGNLRYDDGNWRYEGDGGGSGIGFYSDGNVTIFNAPTGVAGDIASPVERMRITPSGRVGIGTSSPGSMFELVFDNQTPGLSNDVLVRRAENSADWAPIVHIRSRGTVAAPLPVQNGDVLGGLLEHVVLSSTGADGTSTAYIQPVYTGNGTTNLSTMDFVTSGSIRGLYITDGTGQTRVSIPAANGTSLLQDWPVGWGGGLATFDVVGSSTYFSGYNTRSDRRYKTNIQDMDAADALEKLLRLKPVTYNYKEDHGPDGTQLGFIAQDVRDVIPELITGEETEDKKLGLNYPGLIAPLVAAVQELKAAQDELKAENDALRAQHAAILERLEALEAAE